MMGLKLGQAMPVHEVVAQNYGTDHANKIHSDEGAASYGFAGGLVPGVGIYAYMTRPVVDLLSQEWLERGAIWVKFIHPIYDGEKVQVNGRITSVDPVEMSLELINSSGKLCASGAASLHLSVPKLDPRDYPVRPLPGHDQLRPATITAVSIGDLLGSLEFRLDLSGEIAVFLDDVVETSPIYRGTKAGCHPAYLLAKANEVVMQNIALGPWIHTASEVQHYRVAQEGENLSLRGRVVEAYIKRSNEYVVLDLGMFGEVDRPIAHIKHTAIIKLRSS